ncbi:MAG: hypothetical protein RL754_183 [Bacteroidota bacterium]|jgi:beta-glucosidase-like glycosyl hydrolase/CubicO group peptidase (beta-lactamase class C family)
MKYASTSRLSALFIALIFSGQFLHAQSFSTQTTLDTLTLEEKVGQLFMVAGYSNKGDDHVAYLKKLVQEQHIGGIIMMQGGPGRQNAILRDLQSSASLPLLIGQDAEWGQAMRLDSTYKFPTSLTVGAAGSLELAEELGRAMALECKATGVHMSFSPVLDVNTNANNPIIGARSLGSSPQQVAALGEAIIRGFEKEGVLACGKHFPGHGDTHQDSHKTLPKVDRTMDELKAVEWVPFQRSVEVGVSAMMIAHLNIPALEPSGKPTSLSHKVITEILREEWGYDGLVLTDALNMKGVSEFAPAGALEIEAFKAGNDVLLFPTNVPKAAAALVEAFKSGVLSVDELDERVGRILRAKATSSAYSDWSVAKSDSRLTVPSNDTELNERVGFEIVRDAMTLLERGQGFFPIQNLQQNMVHIALGDAGSSSDLEAYLDHYKEMAHYRGSASQDAIEAADVLIVSMHQNTKNPWQRYKLTTEEKAFMSVLVATGKPLYVLHLANPYGVLSYPELGPNTRVLIGYENDHFAQMLAPQFLFGARPVRGTLSVDLGPWGAQGTGEKTPSINRLQYGFPFEVGLNAGPLTRIDSIMNYAIEQGATPGGQVLVARRGNVVYQKSFGQQIYGGLDVHWKDLYDIASVTKITATLPGLMKWYEKQPLLLKSTLGNHTDRLDGSGKEYLVFEDVLAHQSGLDAWIPYYLRTIKTDSAKAYWYTTEPTDGYTAVAPGSYIRSEVRDTMFSMLAASKMKSKEYRYSDLGYYLFQEMLEERFNEPLDSWVRSTFYAPLGADRLTYAPLSHGFSLDEIVPTEEDGYWRHGRVHGYVHDMGAAMFGGVAGHAGLFANSNDLAKMMQMYLNGGTYGGYQFLHPSTVEKFRDCAFCEFKNRRGLGFDKRQIGDGPGPSCSCASDLSFGHTGFTGTMVWMDPKEDLLYVFLSNRTYPDMENWKLSRLNVRTNIQELIYEALQ